MSAMEKMLASMLGITPEKLQETVTATANILQSISLRFESIENRLISIEQKLDLISENYTHEPVSEEQIKYLEAKSNEYSEGNKYVNGQTGN